MPSLKEKAAQFAKMHQSGCFILPNAWDMASAALIAEAGFKAIATTSAGVAFAYHSEKADVSASGAKAAQTMEPILPFDEKLVTPM